MTSPGLCVPAVRVGGQLRPVQVLSARGEHRDQRLLPGRRLHDAAVPGSLSVDEGSPAVPQPGAAGEAQVHVNWVGRRRGAPSRTEP